MANRANDFFIPADPIDVVVRPLTKGVFLDLPLNGIEKGGFSYLNNFLITPRGLKRRPAWISYLNGTQIPDVANTKLVSMAGFWKTNETTALTQLTSDYLYTLTDTAITPKYWTYATGTIYPSGTTVYGVGTAWATAENMLRTGDVFVIDPAGTPAEHLITEIISDTKLTIDGSYTGATTGSELFTRGNCEDMVNSPTLDTSATDVTNCTWGWTPIMHGGSGSWALTKTSTNPAKVSLTDTGEAGTADMHGLTPGAHYLFSFWGRMTNYLLGNIITVAFQEYYDGAWHDTYVWHPGTDPLNENVYLNNIFNIEITAATTGVNIQLRIGTTATASGYFFIDDISFKATQVFDYEVRRTFKLNSDGNLDLTMAVNNGTNYLLIVDGQRPPYKFDGNTLDCLNTAMTYYPNCVCWYKERVFIANITEGTDTFVQRIRWSSVTDYTSFSANDFMDLPYTTASIRRMLPLKQFLVVYTGTGVYLCRPTSYPSVPIVADLLPNSSAGLAGQRAVVSWLDGHFYAGRGDIFYLTESGQIEQIGSLAVKTLLEQCANPQYIQATVDIANDRVIFGIPQTTDNISVLLSFYYKTKSWGIEYKEANFIAAPNSYLGMTWDTIEDYTVASPDTWDSADGVATFGYWDAIGGHEESVGLYYGEDRYLHKLASSGVSDWRAGNSGETILTEFRTPEFDFDDVDNEKSFIRFSLKLGSRPSATLTFAMYASYDGGETWTDLGILSIDNAHREGKVDFVITSSAVMFRGVSNSLVNPYEIIEYCVRVQERGKEINFS